MLILMNINYFINYETNYVTLLCHLSLWQISWQNKKMNLLRTDIFFTSTIYVWEFSYLGKFSWSNSFQIEFAHPKM